MTETLAKAVEILQKNSLSCVVIKEGREDYISTGKGIGPLMDALAADEKSLENAVIADKVVGKAVALVALYGGAKALYGQTMSANALGVLDASGIEYAYGELVPYIENRAKTGYCPMERSVLDTDDPVKAFPALANRLQMLRAGIVPEE